MLSRTPTSNKSPLPGDIAIGKKIRAQRAILGMSQTELANNLGITFQQVQKYEKGVNRVGGGRLAQIANALNVPVAFFYDEMPGTMGDKGVADTLALVRSQGGARVLAALSSIEDVQLRQQFSRLIESVAGAVSDYQKRKRPASGGRKPRQAR